MNDQPLMLRLENLRAFFSMRWDHGRAQTVQDAINDLKDYHFVLAQVPKVYMHVTGGLLSKPNYFADVVISNSDDHFTTLVNNAAEDLTEELAAAYAELRKIRPAIKAVFDRAVWDRAESTQHLKD